MTMYVKRVTIFGILMLTVGCLAQDQSTGDGCSQPVDLVFVIDGSGSICDTSTNYDRENAICDNWRSLRTFLVGIVDQLDIGPSGVRVGAVIFGSDYSTEILWQLSSEITASKERLLQEVNSIDYPGGETFTAKGIDLMIDEVFAVSIRSVSRKIAIVITDGNPTENSGDPIQSAQRAKDSGIEMFSVGVTNNVKEEILQGVASSSSNYFRSAAFDQLSSVLQGLVRIACETPAPEVCSNEVMDLVIVVDGSGSICDSDSTSKVVLDEDGSMYRTCNNWLLIIQFINQIIDQLTIGPNDAQVSVVVFSNTAVARWYLNTYQTKDALHSATNTLRTTFPEGNTYTADALYKVRTEVLIEANGDRSFAPNLVMIMTDGDPTVNTSRTMPEAELLRNKNSDTKVFVVGISEKIQTQTLKELSSYPQVLGENYFTTPNFQQLSSVLRGVLARVCFNVPVVPTIDPNEKVHNDAEDCKDITIDITFLIDGSGSICDNDPTNDYVTCDNWKFVLNFLVNVVKKLTIGEYYTHVALVTFHNEANVILYLDSTYDKDVLIANISGLEFPGGNTYTTEGLRTVKDRVYTRDGVADRLDIRDVVIILTDGVPTVEPESTMDEARALRRYGISMFSLGITTLIDENTLRQLSSDPQVLNMNYFTSPDFEGLAGVMDSLLTSACVIPPATLPPVYGCANSADVALIMDVSGSIRAHNFEYAREFTQALVDRLDIDRGAIRLAMVTYSDNVYPQFGLNDFNDRMDIKEVVANIEYKRGTTNTAEAIRYVDNVIFNRNNGDREGIINIAVVVTDGNSNNKSETIEVAIAAKRNMYLVVLGVGNWLDQYELMSIASDPHEQSLFLVENYEALPGMVDTLRGLLCNNIDECVSNPCMNGGQCVDGVNMYHCICPHPLAGRNCEFRCRKPADVIFALDASGSIQKENFQKVVEFAKEVVMQLPVDDGSRVALETYGDVEKCYFHLRDHAKKSDVLNAMTIPYYSGGTTNTAGAIQYMFQDMFHTDKGDNPDARNIGVVVTDGRSNDMDMTWETSMAARKKNVKLLVVGVGNNIRRDELRKIASYPTHQNVFTVNSFNDLSDIINNIRDSVCDTSDECVSNPCHNEGKCVDEINGYHCECHSQFTGKNCERRCAGNADILFIIDKSGSIRHERFGEVLEFICNIIEDLEIWQDRVRVAALTFDDDAQLEFYLNTYDNKVDIQEAIRSIKYGGKRSNIAAAVEMARKQVFRQDRGDRQNAPNNVVLFTDGGANIREEETIVEAIKARIVDIHITAVAVGQDLNMMELRGLISWPLEKNLISVNSFNIINSMVPDIIYSKCDSVNECLSNPCQNGATCLNKINMYECMCPPDTTGKHCERNCRRPYDVSFVVDLSGSVDSSYNYSIAFMREMVYGFEFRYDTVRAALISYSDMASVRFYLDTYQERRDILNALAFSKVGGRTNTQDAFRMARDEVFRAERGDRSGVTNVIILLTDGGSNVSPELTVQRARDLKYDNTRLHVVAIGSKVDMDEIDQIASGSTEPYIVRITDHDQVANAAERLLNSMCN